MLLSLDIRDVLIIDHLELAFQPGLNVLTGETGAGKSILLDSLGFVLGWRGRAELVRSGASQGEVVAEFALPAGHPAHAILANAGLPSGDTLLLRRVNTRDGRKTGWVNDRRVSGEVLRALSDTLVELHGQQDDRGLLDPRVHRSLLDSFAGLDVGPLRTAWTALGRARKAQAAAEAQLHNVQAEEEFLRHAVAELDALAPEPGEEAQLDAQRRLMQQAERVTADIARAATAMSDDGAERLLGDAARWLEDMAADVDGRLDPALDALSRAMDALGDAQSCVASCMDALEFHPGALEELEDRLFAMRGLARKHGILPDELSAFADDLRARLDRLDNSARDMSELARAVAEAQAHYDAVALAVSEARAQAATKLDAEMAGELAPLKMERAQFSTALSRTDAGAEGWDAVTFEVATNPGAPKGALSKIASGGELSRFLLALKVCLTRGQPDMTMIFDEIDRGVGGATADAVGRRLRALASGAQVLVVTHSPQVAALGEHHWRVEKSVTDGQTLSRVVPLSADERVQEIARMLSGDTITAAACAAAEDLLSAAP